LNWQNVPRDDKTIKRAVLSKRGALVFADYSQVEPRLTAYFAAKIGHPAFAEQIRAGVDSYTAVARLVTGKDEVTEEERQQWKRTYLSLLYGGGVKTIQLQFPELDYHGAKQMISTFHSAWPAVRALQNEVIAVHNDRGYIQTPWGRQLHAEENGEHKLLNKLIQGSAADLMKHAILEVDNGLREAELEARMVSVVHDELILDAPVEEVEVLSSLIPRLMAFPADVVGIDAIVPITADIEVSYTNWAEKEEYQPVAA
jgi:DNA polymerase I